MITVAWLCRIPTTSDTGQQAFLFVVNSVADQPVLLKLFRFANALKFNWRRLDLRPCNPKSGTR